MSLPLSDWTITELDLELIHLYKLRGSTYNSVDRREAMQEIKRIQDELRKRKRLQPLGVK